MNFIIRILITAAIAFGLSKILTAVHIDTFSTALIFAFVLAILNAIVRPLLIILTLPITILTLGIFLFIINAIIIILADKFVDGITIDGFMWALIFSLILSALSSLVSSMFEKNKDQKDN